MKRFWWICTDDHHPGKLGLRLRIIDLEAGFSLSRVPPSPLCGLEHDPGRVVTLVTAPGEDCYGRAFLVEPEVFEHLDHREKNGYERIAVEITFESGSVQGVVYRASESNPAYLGPAPADEMAAQINRCVGPSGSNRDYVLELARALRSMGYSDPHVFEVESWVRQPGSE